MAEGERRRRRHRHSSGDQQGRDAPAGRRPEPVAETSPVHDPEPEPPDRDPAAAPDLGTGQHPAAPARGTGRDPAAGRARAGGPPQRGSGHTGNGGNGNGGNGNGHGGNGHGNGHSHGNGDDRETERGLRGLVGSGSSQVAVGAALRARDAARPTDADIAEAEEHLLIVRRGWVPREDLPRGGR